MSLDVPPGMYCLNMANEHQVQYVRALPWSLCIPEKSHYLSKTYAGKKYIILSPERM